jgi:hypothetical protein
MKNLISIFNIRIEPDVHTKMIMNVVLKVKVKNCRIEADIVCIKCLLYI